MGAANNHHVGVEIRNTLDGPRFVLSVAVGSTSPAYHAYADLSPLCADAADLAPYVGKFKVLMGAILEGVDGGGFEKVFLGLFGQTALDDLQALDDSDPSRPVTSKVWALLQARAGLGLVTP